GPAGSVRRQPDPQQLAVRRVGQHVEIAVRALADVADAFTQVHEQVLAADHLLALQVQPHQLAQGQAAGEQVAAPGRETLVGVEGQAAGADGRHPVVQRLLHARRLAHAFAYRGAVVGQAMDVQLPARYYARSGHY